jgi:16S rRNA processing protein RimM
VAAPEPDQERRSQLRVGRLTKAHGLKGGIKLELFTDDPARRFVPGARFDLQVPTNSPWHGKQLQLVELKWFNSHAVAFFEGMHSREDAETVIKAILWVDHDEAEESAEPDAWFDHQLVGLAVLRDGVELGRVAKVEHMSAQDLLVVDTASGEVLVPFVKAIVTAVDVKGGTVTVEPPLGLFEDAPDA